MAQNVWVYILASQPGGTLYIGQTDNIHLRIHQHKTDHFKDSFSSKYQTKMLVHLEMFGSREDARIREMHLKKYSRKQKLKLISQSNPNWQDLSLELLP